MAGIKLISENPLSYEDAETHEKLEVRKLIDLENGKEILILFGPNLAKEAEPEIREMKIARIHIDSYNNPGWKQALNVGMNYHPAEIYKICDTNEKFRIDNITQAVSLGS